MEPGYAIKDADKCVQMDPNAPKSWARKGHSHHMLKEYHKALEAFDKGLKIDPSKTKTVLRVKQRPRQQSKVALTEVDSMMKRGERVNSCPQVSLHCIALEKENRKMVVFFPDVERSSTWLT